MTSTLRRLWRNGWIRRPLLLGLLAGGLLGLWLGAVAVRNVLFFQRTGLDPIGTNPLRMAAKEVVSTALKPYYDHRLLETAPFPIYDVELSDRRVAEWYGMLRRVTERGEATEEDQEYLPADFRWGDEVWDVELRGRGTFSVHYQPEKPSMRVQFKRDRFFRGMRVMNLIIPYEQARVMVDTTLNAVARQYGLVTYPRRFAVVRLNGRVLGVYQEMEHFRKDLPVKQYRSEGFFISALGEGKGGSEDALHAGFQAARTAVTRCAGGCSPEAAAELLERFLDPHKVAVYAALTTWYSTSHAWGRDNLILFFDPARGRFEPVPWDLGIHPLADGAAVTAGSFESVDFLGDQLLRASPELRALRNRYLWDLLTRKRGFFLDEAERQFEEVRPALDYDVEYSRRRTRRFYDGFVYLLEKNGTALEELLRDARLEVTAAPGELRIANPGVPSVSVESVRVTGAGGEERTLALDAVVPGRYREVVAERAVTLEPGFEPVAVEVRGHNRVTGEPLPAAAVTVTVTRGTVPGDDPTPIETAPIETAPIEGTPTAATVVPEALRIGTVSADAAPPGVTVTAAGDREVWRFAGEVRLSESMALPVGAAAVFEPGLHLLLDPGTSLIVRGDLVSVGREEAPVAIADADPERPFATLAVLGRSHAPASVVVEHTVIEGGSEGDFDGIHFSGAFSIYDGSLEMARTVLRNAAGEDGLNVKYGHVTIRDSRFEGSASDAMDLDFCSGLLERNTVVAPRGDGFDFSGSIVTVVENSFSGSGDKGLSIGEKTTVLADGNTVRDGVTGVAVKDLSIAELSGNRFEGLEAGVAVYRKKPVFGSGFASYRENAASEVATELMTDPAARLFRPAP